MTMEAPGANNFERKNWTLPTDIDLVSAAEEAFTKKLVEAGWDPDSDDVFYLHLAFREALINAIAHGNLGVTKPEDSVEDLGQLAKEEQMAHPTNKKVYVNIEGDKDRVSVTIRDEGNGFNSGEVADPLSPEGVLKAKGRGLLIMNAGFDSVSYNEKGNEVTMIKERKS